MSYDRLKSPYNNRTKDEIYVRFFWKNQILNDFLRDRFLRVVLRYVRQFAEKVLFQTIFFLLRRKYVHFEWGFFFSISPVEGVIRRYFPFRQIFQMAQSM